MNTELITLEMNRFNNFNKYVFLLLLTISSSCNIPNDIGYVMNDDHYTTKVNNILTESFSGNFKMMQSLFHNDVIIKYNSIEFDKDTFIEFQKIRSDELNNSTFNDIESKTFYFNDGRIITHKSGIWNINNRDSRALIFRMKYIFNWKDDKIIKLETFFNTKDIPWD
jgi:hypothetical protein